MNKNQNSSASIAFMAAVWLALMLFLAHDVYRSIVGSRATNFISINFNTLEEEIRGNP